ncbi:hypothetical protein BHE90_010124 [Fusarium euwallaceae]|uniref:Uncharacterized protein n=1 Tax=Fusarium euwallaceae TaxID=1147111 RepID=A0A430LI68_9HYPO|nr:hypothetical protein BHE90_010124 [Fusarium euwallaceae]
MMNTFTIGRVYRTVESALIAEAYGFGRDLGETPSSYFKRGEKLYHKFRGAFRQTFLTSLILRLNDGDKDLRL